MNRCPTCNQHLLEPKPENAYLTPTFFLSRFCPNGHFFEKHTQWGHHLQSEGAEALEEMNLYGV